MNKHVRQCLPTYRRSNKKRGLYIHHHKYHYVIVWRRTLLYGCELVGTNSASGSFTSGISTSSPPHDVVSSVSCIGTVVDVVAVVRLFLPPANFLTTGFFFCCSTARLTNRPFTLIRRSARFFRQLYRIFLFQTRRPRLELNLAIMAARSRGV